MNLCLQRAKSTEKGDGKSVLERGEREVKINKVAESGRYGLRCNMWRSICVYRELGGFPVAAAVMLGDDPIFGEQKGVGKGGWIWKEGLVCNGGVGSMRKFRIGDFLCSGKKVRWTRVPDLEEMTFSRETSWPS